MAHLTDNEGRQWGIEKMEASGHYVLVALPPKDSTQKYKKTKVNKRKAGWGIARASQGGSQPQAIKESDERN